MDRVKNTDTIEEMIREYLSTEIPESKTVNNKIQQAYDEIQNPRQIPAVMSTQKLSKRRRRFLIHCASIAGVLAITTVLFVKKPALAAQLPLIGHIFKDLEQDVSYPGKYSENSIPLSTETASEESPSYKVQSGDMTVTLSEVTYDSNAIYLAILVENEKGFAQNAQSDTHLNLNCQVDMYKADGSKDTFNEALGNILAYYTEGTFPNDHTFKGLVQLTTSNFNVSNYIACDITFLSFSQDLTSGQTLTGKLPGEEETFSYVEYDRKTYEGNWNFHLDLSNQKNTSQEIVVLQTNSQGFGIEKVVKTEYEIYAVPIIPEGKDPMDYVVTIWDNQGQPLETHGDSLEIRSVYGRDVSKVTIYLISWDDFVECKGNNSYRQPEMAVFQTTVEF